jgi:hypothetical protein
MMTKEKELVSPENLQELFHLKKKKLEVEARVLDLMKEMKSLKSISKSLKTKEKELAKLQETLVRSNEELLENRIKFEKSESLLKDLSKMINNSEDMKLMEIQPVIYKHVARIRNKKNSILIDDISLAIETSRSSNNTSRDLKIRSPYFCNNLPLLNSPRFKKGKNLKTPTKIIQKDEKLSDFKGMKKIFDRLRHLLEYLDRKKNEV